MSAEIIREYFSMVEAVHKTGAATEHSYRAALGWLFDKIEIGVTSVNEPKGVKVGRPDFVFQRGIDQITVGHCEAKDIDKDISPKAMDKGNKAQFERYVKGLPNLIYTNCLDFHFYKNGELVREIKIADYLLGLQADESQFEPLWNQLKDFAAERLQTITSAERLAEVMAGKALLIKDVLFNSLREDEDLQTELAGQFKAFKNQLIHDLEIEGFSDIYAETIAYGLFAARLHDEDLETFSRAEALEKLPKSNPFLRKLFEFVAGPSLDDSIKRTIDELAEIFQAVDLGKLFENFGTFTQRNDPFIHFYETFLAKYNPAKRKARGVWYTPEPVVNFIVRAVDDVLKQEFGLADGLADTSKIDVEMEVPHPSKPGKWKKQKESMHRVQILDPAAGTGTFLAEVIKQISDKIKQVAPGQLSSYIEKDLIPRLHGFELLMASYAMCHMKLDMMLTSLGYKPTQEPPRLGVYLTNSLEEGVREVPDLFMARWLSDEARLANDVKRDKPIMCVIGNPPYSIMSGNLTTEQIALVEPYRFVDGQRIKEKGMLQFEKNINNDYIKFIALAERMISKNGDGILSFITSHGYLKSSSFRGLRNHLMKTFDHIRIIDLHGNSEIREVAPNGITDKNIFDIKQGVSLIIALKKQFDKNKRLATVVYSEIWGSRNEKYKILENTKTNAISYHDCNPTYPNYTYHPSGAKSGMYEKKNFSISNLYTVYSSGVITARDKFSISENKEFLLNNANEFRGNLSLTNEALCKKLELSIKKGWDIDKARRRLRSVDNIEDIINDISYRPFDNRKILFDESVVWTTARSTMNNMLSGNNIALVSARSEKSGTCSHFYISKFLVETKCGERTTQSAVFPLYLYPDEQDLDQSIRVNMDPKIRAEIERCAMGLATDSPSPLVGEGGPPERSEAARVRGMDPDASITPHPSASPPPSPTRGEGEDINIQPTKDADGRPNEVAIFDYIYGVLHCPNYRETYKEFLKIDFPRIPYPPSPEVFWDIAEKGGRLRKLHLMEDAAIGETPFMFEGEGNSVVDKVKYEGTSSSPHPELVEGLEDKAGTLRQAQGEAVSGSVFINETQYFKDVPQLAWEFYIGGYQPAQKWLKDRKGRELSFDDIRHYQKIIKILSQTDAIMKTIHLQLE